MKLRLVCLLLAASLVASSAWLVHVPDPVQADAVPDKYRDAVRKAHDYLVKKQLGDGHWEGDEGRYPVAMTGLAGLALVLENDRSYRGIMQGIMQPGETRKHQAQIRKAADWLMSQSRRDGLIYSGHASETSRYMEGHGLAVIFLSAVRKAGDPDLERRKKLTDVINRAIEFIGKAPSSRGGWHHTSRIEGHDFDDVLATVVQIQALYAAEYVGIPNRGHMLNDARDYLMTSLKEEGGAGARRRLETAAALAAWVRPEMRGKRFGEPGQKQDDPCEKWLQTCEAELGGSTGIRRGGDELAHFYFAQAVSLLGDIKLSGYREALCDHLQSTQAADGSWPAAEGLGIGPVYTTALWCTVLQLNNRSHPSLREQFEDVVTFRFEGSKAPRV